MSTKKLSIITLTRIFHLTYQYPTLVREITTPSLPSFITATLNLISVKPTSEPHRTLKEVTPFLETVLWALDGLVSRHPTTFRPFSAQIHSVLIQILGSSGSGRFFSSSVVDLSQRLFVALHHCAPKNMSGDEWTSACRMTIASIHRTADNVFRSVVEQWESTDPNFRHTPPSRDATQVVGDDGSNDLGLGGWEGMDAGANRFICLLRLLATFVSSRTASTVNIPIGAIFDMSARILSVSVPKDGDDGAVQKVAEISRDERDALWLVLPRIHAACIDLFTTILRTLKALSLSVAQTILEQLLWIWDAEKFHHDLRASSYRLIEQMLPLIGPSLTKPNVTSLGPIIRQCCQDLLSIDEESSPSRERSTTSKGGKSKDHQGTANVDAFLNPALNARNLGKADVRYPPYSDAHLALPLFFRYLPVEHLSLPTRAEMDRTAILTAHHDAMMASVMNPVPSVKGRKPVPSILPFLVRRYSEQLDVESLLRPRMPVILSTTAGVLPSMEEAEGEEEQEEESPSSSPEAQQTQPLEPVRISPITTPETGRLGNKRPFLSDTEKNDDDQQPQSPTTSSIPLKTATAPQPKKARLEPENKIVPSSSIPATLSEVSASPATLPSAAAPSVPSIVDQSVSAARAVATRVESDDARQLAGASAAGNVAGEEQGYDEEEDEIPTLTLDSDDDEGENEEEA